MLSPPRYLLIYKVSVLYIKLFYIKFQHIFSCFNISPPRYLLIIKKRPVTSQSMKPSSSRDKVSITVMRRLDITAPIRCTKKA